MRLPSCLVLSLLVCLSLDTRGWAIDYVKPPKLSIENAIELLGLESDRTYYCYAAQYVDAPQVDSKPEHWLLRLAGGYGPHRKVKVYLDGTQEFEDQQDRVTIKQPYLNGLDDLVKAINSSKHLPRGAKAQRQADRVIVSHKLRKYAFHEIADNGEFQEAKPLIGPGFDGFILTIYEARYGSSLKKMERPTPYWKGNRRFYEGFTRGTDLVVDSEYGARTAQVSAQVAALYKVLDPPGRSGAVDQPKRVRPTYSLLKAFKLAVAALGKKDADRYFCSSAKTNVTKVDTWFLDFGAADGSLKTVEVDSVGRAKVVAVLPPDFHLQEKIRDLDTAEKLLPGLLESQGFKNATFKREGNRLTAKLDVRSFRVHPQRRMGELDIYGEEQIEVQGPGNLGLILSIDKCASPEALLELSKQRAGDAWVPMQGNHRPFPYFYQVSWSQPQASSGELYLVELKFGRDVPLGVHSRITTPLRDLKP